MALTTGPILAIGAISITNRVLFAEEDMDWRIPVATGIAVMAAAGAERAWGKGAVSLAYTALVAVIFTRVDPGIPAPVESALRWWNSPPKGGDASRPGRRPGRRGPLRRKGGRLSTAAGPGAIFST